jgi:hypothetical protein
LLLTILAKNIGFVGAAMMLVFIIAAKKVCIIAAKKICMIELMISSNWFVIIIAVIVDKSI